MSTHISCSTCRRKTCHEVLSRKEGVLTVRCSNYQIKEEAR